MTSLPDRFALSQFTTRQSFLEDVAMCRALGIAAIEVCENKLAENRDRAADELRALRDSGLRVSSVQARVHAVFPDQMAPEPADPAVRFDAFRRTMDWFAEALPDETPVYVLIGGRPPHHNLALARDTLFNELSALTQEAAARGARIAFEPLHPVMMNENTFVWSWDEAVTLVQAVGHAACGLVCDLWNVWDQPDIIAQVRAALEHVAIVHVSDWRDGGPRRLDDRLIPGRGVIPFAEWGRMFRGAAFEGWIALEMLSDESLPDSYLHQPVRQVIAEARQHLHDTGCLETARLVT